MRIKESLLRTMIRESLQEPGELEPELEYTPELGDEKPTPPPPALSPLKTFPNREKTNLNIWFGNSKIRNKDGSPKRMYHGTNAAFTAFRVSPGGYYGPGIYFTDNPELASEYAFKPGGYGYRQGISDEIEETPNIIAAYLRVENPYIIPAHAQQNPELTSRAKASGFDGVITTHPGHPFRMVIVHEPWQVKSATGNLGDFDWRDPDITKESRGRFLLDRRILGNK